MPGRLDGKVYSDIDNLVEDIENFKKYKNGELKLKVDDKLVKKMKKHINKCLPSLLKVTPWLKVLALVPILNLVAYETSNFSEKRGALYQLINGNFFQKGLKYFSNENIKKLREKNQ